MGARLCARCKMRPALYISKGKKRSKGKWRADKDHDLCAQCFRSERDRQRAHALNEREE